MWVHVIILSVTSRMLTYRIMGRACHTMIFRTCLGEVLEMVVSVVFWLLTILYNRVQIKTVIAVCDLAAIIRKELP